MKGDRERCLDAGMDGYLSKPVNPQELNATIKELAIAAQCEASNPSHCQTRDEQPAAPQSKFGSEPGEDELADEQGGFDLDAALEHVPGGMQAVKELAPLLVEECANQLEVILEAFAQQNAEVVQRGAHPIKGSVRIFAAERAAEAALRLETMAKDKDLSDAGSTIAALEKELANLTGAIQTAIEA